MNVMHRQIKKLFNNPQDAMYNGLWFSGYTGESEFKRWWSNGQLHKHAFYKDGKKDGEFKMLNADGTFFRHALYKDGELIKDYLK